MSTFIRSKYQQYKRDTHKLAEWLARAAIQNGYSLGGFSEADQSFDDDGNQKRTANQVKNAKKKAKAKAKAQKQAQAQALYENSAAANDQDQDDGPKTEGTLMGASNGAGGSSASTYSTNKTYLIPSNQYPIIAQYLVDRSVRIPAELMQLLDRCIRLRCSCLRRFFENPDASTFTHAHFISVLANVRTIFSEYRAGRQKPSSAPSNIGHDNAEPTDAAWTNMFAELALEADDDNGPENLPDIFVPEPSGPARGPTTRLKFVPQPDREELVIRMLAFFEDMHNVRDEIQALWNRYKIGEIDLITSSVTTNTALELLRASHDDIMKTILPAFDNNLPMLLGVVYNLLYTMIRGTGYHMDGLPLFKHLSDSDVTRTAIFDHLLIPLLQILGGMSDLIVDGRVPVYRPGHFGTYDPCLDFHNLPFTRRWDQSLILMSETFTDYFLLAAIGERRGDALPSAPIIDDDTHTNIFFIDEIALEMNRFSRTKEVSLLVMIYCQIFIDVNFTLGKSVDRGLKALKQGASDMISTLKRRRQIEPADTSSVWHPNNERSVSQFISELESWVTMAPLTLIEQTIRNKGYSFRSKLFERDPKLCGVLLFRLRLKYQHLALEIANAFGTVLASAHLLAACQHSGTLPEETAPHWEDMDVVLDLHGKDDVFGGKYPKNVDDSLVSFLHMAGYSKEVQGAAKHVFTDSPLPQYLQDLKDKKNRKIDARSKSGPKGLTDHSQIVPLFFGKYVGDPVAGTTFNLNALETLLSDIRRDQERAERTAAAGSRGDRRKERYEIRRERKHRSPKFSILQLLSVLETGLAAETTSVRFDYISMHLRCLGLLRQVKLSADDYFVSKIGSNYIENDCQLPFIVGYILQYAALSGRAAERVLGIKREGRNAMDTRSKRLVDATRVVRDFLARTREGSAEVDRMRM
ncbi:hypothetical protein I317_00216 [Kwoniella heveanensis CBS 569]|nr:hypothetical protein I317_00216 [Kwoniella heveanensis CBS 569]